VTPVSPCPVQYISLFEGPRAAGQHGGPPRLWVDGQEFVELPQTCQMFVATGLAQVQSCAIYMTDFDLVQRRAALHLMPIHGVDDALCGMVALRGLTIVAAYLGDLLGVERFWTMVRPGLEGLSRYVGFQEEGRLSGHALRAGQREDILVLGASWRELRKKWAKLVAEIEWG